MINIHPKHIADKIYLPFEEWKLLVQLLNHLSEVKIIEEPSEGSGINSLIGLGSEIWTNIDPVEYQRAERDKW